MRGDNEPADRSVDGREDGMGEETGLVRTEPKDARRNPRGGQLWPGFETARKREDLEMHRFEICW